MAWSRVAVVMPAYQEHEGIVDFLKEIDDSMLNVASDVVFVVVDDASPEPMAPTLACAESHLRAELIVYRNDSNLGHGPSVMRAYQEGLRTGADCVIHVDGDGQFRGQDFPRLLDSLESSEVVYGIRVGRKDPWFRRVISYTLRAWLGDRRVTDINTPLRAYRSRALIPLLESVEQSSTVPHIRFSLLEVAWQRSVATVDVEHRERRGSCETGTMWGSQPGRLLPPKRLIEFCISARREVRQAQRDSRQHSVMPRVVPVDH